MYVQPTHQRCVAGTSFDLSWQQIGGDGEPANPGTVTATITRANGTVLAAAGATGGTGVLARTYSLTAAQTATLDRLTVTWSASGVVLATTEIDVCAAPFFSNAQLRAEHPSITQAKYDAPLITLARLQVEGFIESVTGRRFTPGYAYRTMPAAGGCELVLPNVNVRSIRSAELLSSNLSATTVDVSTLVVNSESGIVTRTSGVWSGPWARLGYEYGMVTPPGDLRSAAMRLTREVLERSKVVAPDQAITWNSTDFGWSAVMVTPGVRGAHTSLPTVNEVLDRYTFTEIGIA